MSKNTLPSALKRLLDAVVAATLLVLLAPAMLAVWVLIGWKMGRPAFFSQWRPGLNGQPFRLYKFRTMTPAASEAETLQPDALRLTALGIWLRRTSLDELPQLWNVLRGHMSLVGPRPLRMEYLPYYTPREQLRHSVRPGITGWAQIHGRNEAAWDARLAKDVWYVENWSLGLDLRILLATLLQVFRRQNVNLDPHALMSNLNEERSQPERRAA